MTKKLPAAAAEAALIAGFARIAAAPAPDQLTLRAAVQSVMIALDGAGFELRPAFRSAALGFVDLSGADYVARIEGK